MTKATTLIDVRNDLLKVWDAVNGPKPDLEKIAQQNNTAGKLLAFAALDLKASIYMKLKPDTAFLGLDERAPKVSTSASLKASHIAANSPTIKSRLSK